MERTWRRDRLETVEELVEYLQDALVGGARGRVLDTGEAWSIMRSEGKLPKYAPDFRRTMDADLAEYGFAVLDAGLELNALKSGHPLARRAFATSGKAFENLVRNGNPADPKRGFYRVVAAASYHLGSFAAIAYALFRPVDIEEQNLNTAEICLVKLMLRDLNGVREIAKSWLSDVRHTDKAIAVRLRSEDADRDSELALILIGSVCRALVTYEFALLTGVSKIAENSTNILRVALKLAGEIGMSSLWWVLRLTLELLDDLWNQSLHMVLPHNLWNGALEEYSDMRTIFIASLLTRDVAEVELWPSQLDAARRAADPSDDLVVALPTSAGKTRIAELATLTAIAMRKRILVVTPLRALSAQSERSFRSRFAPLGATVSALYGKSGLTVGDADALRSHDIVVATPEKLDFALRSDPTIISDVGLIVLDEGHLIGPGEREIHYEVLVQRLLRRYDAGERRIVCLSAILPDGEHLNDMTAWIRSDEDGEPVRSEWRPTRQRFGTLEWRGEAARLNYDLDDNGPFDSRFIWRLHPPGKDKKTYPQNLRDVALMSAWRFAQDGKRTLIYITQANWVDGYGKRAVNLVENGYFPSLLEEPEDIEAAVTIGIEWLGHDHPAVRCLSYGVAVHHGNLPSPFLREVERLLVSGTIKITAASPTLAQGLNLNAAVLLVPYLYRGGKRILGEELANVAGRAGRAFVDTEGLVLHVMYDKHWKRRGEWRELVNGVQKRSLTSGLVTVIAAVIQRLAANGIEGSEGYEYLANSREAWLEDVDGTDGEALEDLVAKVDSIVLGLVEALDANADDLPELLELALLGSLWERQLGRWSLRAKRRQMHLLEARARLIWKETTVEQRRGHYAMGVGLETGVLVDEMADGLAYVLDLADWAALVGDVDALYKTLVILAKRLLTIRPFAPDKLNGNWINILREWINGTSMSDIGSKHVKLIEDAFMYRLVWSLEAIRVRRQSLGWEPKDGTIAGAAAACVDTGLPDYRMTLLVRSGLASRAAAQAVVNKLNPNFFNDIELRQWLGSEIMDYYSFLPNWPTKSTESLWRRFRSEALSNSERAWVKSSESYDMSMMYDHAIPDGSLVRVGRDPDNFGTWLMGADFKRVGWLFEVIEDSPNSVTYAKLDLRESKAHVLRIGPEA